MDFACKKFNLDEIVRCSLTLTKAEFKILEFLMKNSTKKFSSIELANKLNLELSTIQRSMKKMTEKNIVTRSQVNLQKAGYTFVYCICNKIEIKNIIKSTITTWTNRFNQEIENW